VENARPMPATDTPSRDRYALTQVRHGTFDFGDFETPEWSNSRPCNTPF
jgi:hypothetical protein